MAENVAEEFWPNFGIYQWPTVECGDGSSLAVKVLNEYNIPISNNSLHVGGPLENLDIKHMDAMQVIKSSLFDESAREGDYFKEPHVNADGEVEFISIPGETADLDIYHTVQTHKCTAETKGVMITGGKPIPVRKLVERKLIWADEEHVERYNSEIMEDNCNATGFASWANVVFTDPHLNTAFEDGIDNFYEITRADNPYDKLLGYASVIYYGDHKLDDTTVNYTKQSKIIIKLPFKGDYPDVGTLQKKKEVFTEEGRKCWYPTESPSFEYGVEIPIPTYFRYEYIRKNVSLPIDHLLGISTIFIVGIELDECYGGAKNQKGSQTSDNNNIFVYASDVTTKTMKLSEGDHYVIVYDESGDFKIPYVVFSDNGRFNDSAEFGNGVVMHFKDGGELHRTEYANEGNNKATLLPLGGIKGFLVKSIYAVVNLDIPSFEINDPKGNAALIANDLKCYLSPIVIADPPHPIAFNGNIIDQVQGRFDSDPTTQEDLSETDFEKAMDIMEGSGVTMEFSYLIPEYSNPSKAEGDITGVEDDIRNLSAKVFDYMNDPSGDLETTYTCGPNSKPKLGDVTPNGVINSITYSYNDKSSYTISVNAGARLMGGFAELGQGLYYKQQESTSSRGTIIQNQGNHVVFKVRIDGYGDVYAMNTCKEILREGDIVQCTIHNNPVGEK